MPSVPSTPQKILIINIFGIGDVLFTTPLISNLKAAYPDVKIGYVANGRTAGMLENDPDIDRIFVYDRDAMVEAGRRSRIEGFRQMWSFINSIKRERFDLSIDVSLSAFTNWLTWMAGIKRRTGFDFKNRGFFLNRKIPLKGYEDRHVVEYYLDLLVAIGVPAKARELKIHVKPEDTHWAEAFIKEKCQGLNGQKPIGLVPGGGASWGQDARFKRWAPEKFAKLADNLIEKSALPIILMGDKGETAICEEVAGHMAHSPILACGTTSISQFAALARQCALMIVNDGGPLHISVAAGVRTASIFGPVDDRVYGPYPQGNHIVIKKEIACRPCYRRFRRADCAHISCLDRLSADDVFDQVKVIL